VLHKESTAVKVLRESGGGIVLDFSGENDIDKVEHDFEPALHDFFAFLKEFNPAEINHSAFEKYSASNITRELAALINTSLSSNYSRKKHVQE
jgi:hypothetical protein